MTLALALLLAAAALGSVGPAYLRPAADPRVHPALALSVWMVTLSVAGGAAVAAAAVLVLPDPSVPDGMLGIAVTCWRVIGGRESGLPWLLLARLVVGTTLLAFLARGAVVFVCSLVRERAHRIGRIGALRAVAEVRDDIWWVPSDELVAFSVGGGRSGVVVASTGLRRLDRGVVAAVLAHERAHVRGRHHLAVSLAGAVARAMPLVPLCRAAPAAIGVLCELAADARAVRRCGPDAVARALREMASTTGAPRGAVGFDAFPEIRTAWLTESRRSLLRGSGPVPRAAATGVALIPALLPGLGAVAAVLAVCLGR